ncbi:MAG: MFS transporter [Thermoanaerobaculia bacterium]
MSGGASLPGVATGGNPRVAAGRGTVIAWSLYELGATSIAMNMLSLHLPLDIASRVPRGSEKFSIAFGLSMAVVALLAPFLGRIADERGKRRFLVPFVLAGVAFTALVAAPGPVTRTLVFFALANIAFQSAYVFYNALLPDITDETTQGKVSGFGVAAGYLGSLTGMFLVLPFVSGGIRARMPGFVVWICDWLSVAPVSTAEGAAFTRVNAYIPTAFFWLLAALPLLFLARLPKPTPRVGPRGSAFADVVKTIRSLPKTPSILWFLASNFLYIDVIHTIQIQMSTYSRFAVGLSDRQVQILLFVATAIAIVGGLLYGLLCQYVTIRTATLVALANWVLVFALALTIRSPRLFPIVGVLAGVGLGGIKVTSRLGLVALVPKERMTEFFGFFTLAGEAASVLGPFIWALTLSRFPDQSPEGYRTALFVLFLVLLGSILVFLKVRFEPPVAEERVDADGDAAA